MITEILLCLMRIKPFMALAPLLKGFFSGRENPFFDMGVGAG